MGVTLKRVNESIVRPCWQTRKSGPFRESELDVSTAQAGWCNAFQVLFDAHIFPIWHAKGCHRCRIRADQIKVVPSPNGTVSAERGQSTILDNFDPVFDPGIGLPCEYFFESAYLLADVGGAAHVKASRNPALVRRR
jgi:hypothetical protein